ncbi:MAG: hypothetical protein Q4B23_00895 [Helcococcus sp.]|nr:hypothetical protein [Helcococcus sp.]
MEVKLDGKTVDYSKITKANGHLVIKINLVNKEFKDIKIDGETRRIYRPYLADVVFIAENDLVENIKYNIGDVIKDGSRLILSSILAPGMKETLGSDLHNLDIKEINDIKEYLVDDLILEMDVKDFTPQAIMIGFTNLDLSSKKLKDANNLDSLKDSLKELNDNGDKLLAGSKQLVKGQEQFLKV